VITDIFKKNFIIVIFSQLVVRLFHYDHFQLITFSACWIPGLNFTTKLEDGLVFLHNDVENNEHKRTTAIYEKKKTRKHAKRPFWKKSAKTR